MLGEPGCTKELPTITSSCSSFTGRLDTGETVLGGAGNWRAAVSEELSEVGRWRRLPWLLSSSELAMSSVCKAPCVNSCRRPVGGVDSCGPPAVDSPEKGKRSSGTVAQQLEPACNVAFSRHSSSSFICHIERNGSEGQPEGKESDERKCASKRRWGKGIFMICTI